MRETPEETFEEKYMDACKRLYGQCFYVSVCQSFIDKGMMEDYSKVSSQEILEKIRAFNAQEPSDVNSIIFMQYLSCYPVSMCKREVSKTLQFIIGFHYRLGVPSKEQEENGAQKVSFDDLAAIFVRSKATIKDCVDKTAEEWRAYQAEVARSREIEAAARQQLIEEQKQRLKIEEINGEQTIEQT